LGKQLTIKQEADKNYNYFFHGSIICWVIPVKLVLYSIKRNFSADVQFLTSHSLLGYITNISIIGLLV
jgi:hypothetical protein